MTGSWIGRATKSVDMAVASVDPTGLMQSAGEVDR
jgi:hypothetical protein